MTEIIIIYAIAAVITWLFIVTTLFNKQDHQDFLAQAIAAIAGLVFPVFWIVYWMYKNGKL